MTLFTVTVAMTPCLAAREMTPYLAVMAMITVPYYLLRAFLVAVVMILSMVVMAETASTAMRVTTLSVAEKVVITFKVVMVTIYSLGETIRVPPLKKFTAKKVMIPSTAGTA